ANQSTDDARNRKLSPYDQHHGGGRPLPFVTTHRGQAYTSATAGKAAGFERQGMAADVTLLLGEELDSIDTNHYISLISFTILVYDYFLTLHLEVERFWGLPLCFNWAAAFFFLNRYMNTHPRLKCHELQTYHQYIAIAVQVVVAAMLIMRMYALYERSRRVLALYLTVSVSVVGVACWAVLGGKMNTNPPDIIVDVGCGVTLTHSQAIRLAVAWSGMLVFDSLVFGMTLYKSLTLPRTIDLLSLLLRDGAIYFGVMIASNIANILTFILGGPFTRGVATTFTNIISSVMISRLMLNLRAPSLTANAKGSGGHRTPADTTFPDISFVGPGETTYPQRTVVDTESCIAELETGEYGEERGRSRRRRRGSSGSNRRTSRWRVEGCDDQYELEEGEAFSWRPGDEGREKDGEEKLKQSSVVGGGEIAAEERNQITDGRMRGLLEGYDYVSRGPGRPEGSTSSSTHGR
ncbi:hypothetical protein CVT24_000425, partial [Panaeolus cyanescens]